MLQFNYRTFGRKEGRTIITTKEKIRREALALFAKKGYYGTSISDLADAVGISKASLYSHYSGKDDVFLAVYEDVVSDHGRLFDRLVEASQNMAIQERLRYNFVEYIIHFYRNTEIQRFSNQSLFHVPLELYGKLRSDYLNREMQYRKSLENAFLVGMQQGIIRNDDPSKKVWSFKTKRDGVLGWLCASPELTEESIEEFWHDFWFGVTERK